MTESFVLGGGEEIRAGNTGVERHMARSIPCATPALKALDLLLSSL